MIVLLTNSEILLYLKRNSKTEDYKKSSGERMKYVKNDLECFLRRSRILSVGITMRFRKRNSHV